MFSATARRTSARPDIQASRAAALRRWREANPDLFAEAVAALERSSRSTSSKMERWLRRELGWPAGRVPCLGTAKLVDFVSGDVWVEVDGFYHFFQAPSRRRPRHLADVQARDRALNAEASRRGSVTLLRLSMECFASSTGAMKPAWLETMRAMLRSPTPGVWCLGALYESCPWASAGCTILRSPATPTTSSCPAA